MTFQIFAKGIYSSINVKIYKHIQIFTNHRVGAKHKKIATGEIPDTNNILPKLAYKRLIFFQNWTKPEFHFMMNIREFCVYFTPAPISGL